MLAWPWDLALSSLLTATPSQGSSAEGAPVQPSRSGDRSFERLSPHDSSFGPNLMQNNCGEDEEDEGSKPLSSAFLPACAPPLLALDEADARLPAALMLRAPRTAFRLNPLRC